MRHSNMLHLVHSTSSPTISGGPLTLSELEGGINLTLLTEGFGIAEVIFGRADLGLVDIRLPYQTYLGIADEMERVLYFRSAFLGAHKTVCGVRELNLTFEIDAPEDDEQEHVLFINHGPIGSNTISMTASCWEKIGEIIFEYADRLAKSEVRRPSQRGRKKHKRGLSL